MFYISQRNKELFLISIFEVCNSCDFVDFLEVFSMGDLEEIS